QDANVLPCSQYVYRCPTFTWPSQKEKMVRWYIVKNSVWKQPSIPIFICKDDCKDERIFRIGHTLDYHHRSYFASKQKFILLSGDYLITHIFNRFSIIAYESQI